LGIPFSNLRRFFFLKLKIRIDKNGNHQRKPPYMESTINNVREQIPLNPICKKINKKKSKIPIRKEIN
jgi:hypothetical protein